MAFNWHHHPILQPNIQSVFRQGPEGVTYSAATRLQDLRSVRGRYWVKAPAVRRPCRFLAEIASLGRHAFLISSVRTCPDANSVTLLMVVSLMVVMDSRVKKA